MKQRPFTVYYAHPMSWYGTPEEAADVAFLETQYARVINPSAEHIVRQVDEYIKLHGPGQVMQYFADIIRDDVDEVVFRRFNDGKIGSGVAREVFEAKIWDKPTHAIFTDFKSQRRLDRNFPGALLWPMILTVDQTRARIKKGTM